MIKNQNDMSLNKSNGNMYPGVKTWNPLGGECPHKCAYCSTKTMMRFPGVKYKYSGELRLFNDLFRLPNKSKTIFVASQNDLFAEKVPSNFIKRVLSECNKHRQHTFLFQTKNPIRFMEEGFVFPYHSIFCTTIETNRTYPQMGNTPPVKDRAFAMNDTYHEFIARIEHLSLDWIFQVTIEPIFDFDLEEMVYLIETCLPDKVNIGADSKHNHLPEPSKEKILALIDELKKFTVIDRKTNLQRLLK